MKRSRPWQVFLALGAIFLVSGCLFTSKTSLNSAQAQSRILAEQNAAQLAEIGNLKNHSNDLENKLNLSEEQIALLKQQVDLDSRQMANYEREHTELYEQFKALARERAQASDQMIPPQQTGNSNSREVR
jgi:chromosome segregation ATPase